MCQTKGCDNTPYPGFKFCSDCLVNDVFEPADENVHLGPICHRDENPELFFVYDLEDEE